MDALAQLAAPRDLAGLIAGVLAAGPGIERDAAERVVVRVMRQIQEPGKRAEMGATGMNRTRQLYRVDAMCDATLAAYERVLAAHRPGGGGA